MILYILVRTAISFNSLFDSLPTTLREQLEGVSYNVYY